MQTQESAHRILLSNQLNASTYIPQTQDHQVGRGGGVDLPAKNASGALNSTLRSVQTKPVAVNDDMNKGAFPGQMNSTGQAVQNPLWKASYTKSWLSS